MLFALILPLLEALIRSLLNVPSGFECDRDALLVNYDDGGDSVDAIAHFQ